MHVNFITRVAWQYNTGNDSTQVDHIWKNNSFNFCVHAMGVYGSVCVLAHAVIDFSTSSTVCHSWFWLTSITYYKRFWNINISFSGKHIMTDLLVRVVTYSLLQISDITISLVYLLCTSTSIRCQSCICTVVLVCR